MTKLQKIISKIISKTILSWFVYCKINESIEPYDVFTHYKFKQSVIEAYLDCNNYADFCMKVLAEAQYYFHSHTEYELILTDIMSNAFNKKVSIFSQLYVNWENFINYIWGILEEITADE